jgi:uncharacterized protein YoxC
MTNVLQSVAIDLLILLVSVIIGIIGFYLGSELKKHERRIDNLDGVVMRHDSEIKNLRTDVDNIMNSK